MADNEFLPKLSQNLLEIMDDDEYYDIKIEVGNEPHVKIFRAHMVILNYRSPYLKRILSTNKKNDDGTLAHNESPNFLSEIFKIIFSTDKKNNDGTLSHIKLPNILPDIFQIILRYIYSGRLSLAEYDTSDVVKILIAASELNLQELIPYLQSFLIKNKPNWIEQNFNLIYQTSFENDSLLDLQKFCTELISKQPEKIFNSPDFTSISEKALIFLIQHVKFNLSEVQVWEHVLKWGITQNPGLSSDPSCYSNDDFNALKNTLQQCIPLFKFTEFTSREFLNNVYPYKQIIPDEMRENIIKYFLDHDYVPSKKSEPQIIKKLYIKGIDSNIITIQHAELISKWIDRLEITDELTNSYEFKLIFRGSLDGFTAKRFHEVCDNQSHTVTIIKVKDSNEILGGYNPIEWKSNNEIISEFGTTNDSFIFSFMNKENIENCLITRVKKADNAIRYSSYYGPSFGFGDLEIYGGYQGKPFNENTLNHCRENSYEKQIRETSDGFSIEEYEVFQIHK